ncbi:1-acyl-sn-glycerol-3-phosphate acyltransferase [Parapedobacter composti]|uniref:1-acyl-sn-glycerol-3-phosphate acyltransferase n=1 Tax=Parapedobacter composti TaxID=623281 RepID=A0A1I1LG08_9SPHI|nr:lysophospholipid acyltransferase family protein [Parapedobacter composti]SFC71896.1 1-acyl-sn-glycerol-3-phosphate acyltransferase [Parapedobacter composti]
MVRLLRKLHSFLYLGSVLFFFILFFPALAFFSTNPERHFHRIARCRRIIGFLSSAAVGVFYRFRFEVPIDWSRPYIICPNHTSNLDITAMVLLCPADFSFMGKVELLDNPVTGLFFRTIDIPVNRKSKLSAFKAFKRAHQNLLQGRSVLIFPEGQIGDEYPPKLYDFKNGPFRLAIETDVPVLPVVIQNAWEVYWDEAKQHGSRPGIIDVDVLAPVGTHNLGQDDADTLRDEIHARIKKRWSHTGAV